MSERAELGLDRSVDSIRYPAWTPPPMFSLSNRWSGGQTLLTANDSNRHPSMLLFLPCSPDLSCLKHHSSLTSLAIEAPSSGWQLASLQLGYLVHLDTLKQLSLASRCWGPAGHVGQLGVQSPVSPGGIKSPGVLRCGNGTLQASNSR